ncbi:unnamed protein product [Rhizophagus irregularis]|nr:unnamed protein product [Rhizophagus irregularis]
MNSFNKKNDDETGPINSKITHANLLHARWSSKYKKQVVSLRTGRSYQVHYSARDLYDIKDSVNTHIYSKKLDNFKVSLSSKSRTAKKQNERYARSTRRIFSKHMPIHGNLTQSDYLRIGRRHKFIFTEKRSIKFPIKHLHYRQARCTPYQQDYHFLIPYEGTMCTVEPYNLTPNMFIPVKYRNIIPPDPSIYSSTGTFIIPESREWFTYMYNLERNKRTRIGAETYTRSRNQAILENGTTERHYDLRMGMKRCLTALTDYYHDGIRNYDDYTEFMRVYRDKIRSYHDINNKFLGTKKGRLTADTIRAKIRPNKRDCSSTYNIDRDLSSSIVKKPRHGDCPRDLLIKHDILNM